MQQMKTRLILDGGFFIRPSMKTISVFLIMTIGFSAHSAVLKVSGKLATPAMKHKHLRRLLYGKHTRRTDRL